MGRDVNVGHKSIQNASRNSFMNPLAVISHYFDEALKVATLTNLITETASVTATTSAEQQLAHDQHMHAATTNNKNF